MKPVEQTLTPEKAQAARQFAQALLDTGVPVEHVIADVRRAHHVRIDASELTITPPRAAVREKSTRWNPWQGTPSPK